VSKPKPDNEPKPEDLVMPLDDLMAMADVSEDDIAEAQEWWNETASDEWKGALDDDEG
jgi:hypothetical protein